MTTDLLMDNSSIETITDIYSNKTLKINTSSVVDMTKKNDSMSNSSTSITVGFKVFLNLIYII